MGYVDIRHLLQVSMERRPFQSSLWNEIVNFPYREDPVRSDQFMDDALHIAFNQHQTPLHDAFFQRNVANNRAEANALWRSLFKTYDDLVDAEMRVDREEESAGSYYGPPLEHRQLQVKEERDLPLAARYLNTVPRDTGEPSPEEANIIANVLVGHSTFGIAFSRKVTHPEAKIVVRNIRAVVKRVQKSLEERMNEKIEELKNPDIILRVINEDFGLSLTAADMGNDATATLVRGKIKEKLKMQEASEDELLGAYFSSKMDVRGVIEREVSQIQELFYQPYSTEIVSENKTKLSNHRMNCIVVALQTFYEKLREDVAACRLLGISADTDVFELIDEPLWGDPASTPMTSRARFERLQGLYPEAFEVDF